MTQLELARSLKTISARENPSNFQVKSALSLAKEILNEYDRKAEFAPTGDLPPCPEFKGNQTTIFGFLRGLDNLGEKLPASIRGLVHMDDWIALSDLLIPLAVFADEVISFEELKS